MVVPSAPFYGQPPSVHNPHAQSRQLPNQGAVNGRYVNKQSSIDDSEHESSVTAGSALCCLLFLVLILLGIALIAAGATVYVQNDGYMKARLQALTDMCDRWVNVCEGKMNKAVGEKLRLTVKAGSTLSKDHKLMIGTMKQDIPEVEKSGLNVTFVSTKVDVYTRGVDAIEAEVHTKQQPDDILAQGSGIPLRHEVDIPAICHPSLLFKHCSAKDMCGDLTFKGDLKDCTDKKECGRCQGSGYLQRVCLIGDFCDDSKELVELVGCEYPFQPGSQIYAAKEPAKVEFLLLDVNTPSIMKQLILDGSDINAPSMEQAASRKKGKILFGVGIPVLVVAFFSLIILCAYRRWMCFAYGDKEYRRHHVNEDAWSENAIPMHGLSSNDHSRQAYTSV